MVNHYVAPLLPQIKFLTICSSVMTHQITLSELQLAHSLEMFVLIESVVTF